MTNKQTLMHHQVLPLILILSFLGIVYFIGYWLPFERKIQSYESRGIFQKVSEQQIKEKFNSTIADIPYLEQPGIHNEFNGFRVTKKLNIIPPPKAESIYDVDYTIAEYKRAYSGTITPELLQDIVAKLKERNIVVYQSQKTLNSSFIEDPVTKLQRRKQYGVTIYFTDAECSTEYILQIANDGTSDTLKNTQYGYYTDTIFSVRARSLQCSAT